ncbi:hypothetical protein ACFS07_31850 [Undibacterium arcticum]
MKQLTTLFLTLAFTASNVAFAQSGDMKDMDMKQCMEMKGMNGMDRQKCEGMMDMHKGKKAKDAAVHQASGVVKAVDQAKGSVTLAHGPVKKFELASNDDAFRGERQDALR